MTTRTNISTTFKVLFHILLAKKINTGSLVPSDFKIPYSAIRISKISPELMEHASSLACTDFL